MRRSLRSSLISDAPCSNVEEDDLVFGEHIAREDVYPTSGDPKPIDMRIVDGIAPMHEPYRSLR